MSGNSEEFRKGYEIGVHDGRDKALLELQDLNEKSDLPSNETLYRIFDLLLSVKKTIIKPVAVIWIHIHITLII